MNNKYQNITEFLSVPFNRQSDLSKDTTYDAKYRQVISHSGIKLHAFCVIEDSYYIHIKIPSESQKDEKYMYDVVIRFFTDNPDIAKQTHLRNYYIQFFSNSPSFMYQYAYLYNKEGFLIETLYHKLDPEYIDTPPEKTNAEMKLMYDKSIYFACRYLSDMKFKYLDKRGLLLGKKKNASAFFRDISDFQSIKIDQTLMNEEKKLARLLDNKSPKSRKGIKTSNKKTASSQTSKEKRTVNILRKSAGGRISKKVSKKTTRKS